MNDRHRLILVGITYNQIESGLYAMILQEENGNRRIPIIIGSAEAQSIECKLQEIVTPRTLTHDLFVSLLSALGGELREVFIRRMDNGVFAADIVIFDGESEIRIDSRSSDAIAIAVRVGAPIYTSSSVLEETGFEQPSYTQEANEDEKEGPKESFESQILSSMSEEHLRDLLLKMVEKENYESAKKIKDELDRRQNLTK